MKLGIFGGTFNPVHLGHLIVAAHVHEAMGLDRVLFIPSAISPHKLSRSTTDGVHRIEMLKLAIDGNAAFEVSEIELRRGGVSYTVDTLRELRKSRRGDSFFVLIGMDNLLEFSSWKDPEGILELSQVVVMTRPGFEDSQVNAEVRQDVLFCSVPEIEISSSGIRQRVGSGKSIKYLVPPAVESYILAKRLYQCP